MFVFCYTENNGIAIQKGFGACISGIKGVQVAYFYLPEKSNLFVTRITMKIMIV